VRSVKHPFPVGKLPVRGKFSVACMLIGSAAMSNVRRIQHYLESKMKAENREINPSRAGNSTQERSGVSIFAFAKAALVAFRNPAKPLKLSVSC
jgi:hypothetical protein